jgi:hypothetical protein
MPFECRGGARAADWQVEQTDILRSALTPRSANPRSRCAHTDLSSATALRRADHLILSKAGPLEGVGPARADTT